MFSLKSVAAGATALALLATLATAETVIRIQSVLGNSSDEVFMLQSFADDVEGLTGGSVKIEILPAGAVVGPRDIMDAVDAGLVEGGFAWTHYWGGKHPAVNLRKEGHRNRIMPVSHQEKKLRYCCAECKLTSAP